LYSHGLVAPPFQAGEMKRSRSLENMETIRQLQVGDIIRNIGSGTAYTIISVTGGKILAVREIEITNPPEWELVIANKSLNADQKQRGEHSVVN
jgi:hypothetical protein